MKLAEALQERADVQRRLAQLKGRLRSNARVQEGETPAEDPKLAARLEELVRRINLTNAATDDGGETLTALIARRDALQTKAAILRDFLGEASELASRSMRSEIKIKSTVNVAEKRKEVDALSQEIRLLDSRIQQRNWLADLL